MTVNSALNQSLPSPTEPYVLRRDEGPIGHFLNNLVTTKVAGSAGGSMAVVQANAPKGFGPPLHSHDDEDEMIVVLDGEVTFRCADIETTVGPGGLAYFPSGHAHTFQVLTESSRMLNITTSSSTTPRFDAFVGALSTPTDSIELPQPSEVDGGRVAQVGAEHSIQILGPPPAPLV